MSSCEKISMIFGVGIDTPLKYKVSLKQLLHSNGSYTLLATGYILINGKRVPMTMLIIASDIDDLLELNASLYAINIAINTNNRNP